MSRSKLFALVVLGIVVGAAWGLSAQPAQAAVTDAAYTPVTPCVVFDTRSTSGAVEPYQGPMIGGEVIAFGLTGTFPASQGGGNTTCGIPATAAAAHINIVAVDALTVGNLRADDGAASASGGIVNYANVTPALNNSNAATIPLDVNGMITIRANCGPSCTSPTVQARGIVLGYYSTTLATKVATLENRIAALEAKLAGVTRTGSELTFTGVNLNLRNGAGSTSMTNGLGNLTIGYNESNSDSRTGSHNLIVGPYHTYSSYGGVAFGYNNTVIGPNSSITGGTNNTASGQYSSVSGGYDNTASGGYSSVSGGFNRAAAGIDDWVGGGLFQDY